VRYFLPCIAIISSVFLFGAAGADDPEGPRAAAARFFAAEKTDDPAKIAECIYLRGADELGAVAAFYRLFVAERRLTRVVSLQFKDETGSVVHARNTDAQLDETAKIVASAPLEQDGDSAKITATLVGDDEPEILYFRRSGMTWKVDLGRSIAAGALYPATNPAEIPVKVDIWFYLAMADGMNRLADDVAAGKYKTFKEVKEAAAKIPSDVDKQEVKLLK